MGDSPLSMTETPPNKSFTLDDTYHNLKYSWVIWAHLPHDTDWSLKSYKKLGSISSVEATIEMLNAIPDKVTKNCMLFIMKQGINPTWEDPHNANGGCFSYKISNTDVCKVWKNLSYCLVGESLLTKNKNNITGITISPKKNFCIIKIWMSDCNNQNPTIINYFEGIDAKGCLFKKHKPDHSK